MRRTLIVGATSAIAEATARLFAEAGDALFLVARDRERLAATADDLRVRGACEVWSEALDVLDYHRHQSVIDAAIRTLGGLDLVLIAHGTLPDQKECERSAAYSQRHFEINALSTISLLVHLANYFEAQGRGTIAVISSVAGDRGRQSNYLYGAAKGAVMVFLQGLRNRLFKSGVRVITIKPGFVDTPMTASFEKGLLWIDPERVAQSILSVVENPKDEIYVPWFWRVILRFIKLIPERIFKRLAL